MKRHVLCMMYIMLGGFLCLDAQPTAINFWPASGYLDICVFAEIADNISLSANTSSIPLITSSDHCISHRSSFIRDQYAIDEYNDIIAGEYIPDSWPSSCHTNYWYAKDCGYDSGEPFCVKGVGTLFGEIQQPIFTEKKQLLIHQASTSFDRGNYIISKS